MAFEENGQNTKHLEPSLAFTHGYTGIGKVSFGSHPGLLDVPLMDPKRNFGRSKKTHLKISVEW